MKTSFIIEEIFIADDEDERKKHFEELLLNIISESQLDETA